MITKFKTESPAVRKTAKEKDPHRIGTDQKSKMRHLKRIPVLSPHRPELQRSCKRHRPGSSGLPAPGMFLRSLDRVFRDTADSLADPSGA